MIGLPAAYALAGLVFLAVSLSALLAHDGRPRGPRALFFGLIAASFLLGDRLGDLGNGVLVIALVAVGAFGGLRSAPLADGDAWTPARAPGWAVFVPILAVPALTLAGTALGGYLSLAGRPLVDPRQATPVWLALGALLGGVLAIALFRPPAAAPAAEARRLLEGVGSAAILPQLLAALGAVFSLAGVGGAMQTLFAAMAPLDNRLAVVALYCGGMALFTTALGNAFAAFPVMVAALGAPILIGRMGADPALVGAVGMLSGYCGTLVTPMAAFNIVPTALLELPPGAVIRVQAPTAAAVLLFNIALMWLVGFR